MTDKALLIGINEYPDAPLRGCVPDIADKCDWLHQFGFCWEVMDACTDRPATTKGMIDRMMWLVEGAKWGDRLLLWCSMHGAQIPTRSSVTNEVDGLTEVLCPIDFDFRNEMKMIIDDDFIGIFERIPPGVNCTVVLDSCFSGGMVPGDFRGDTDGDRVSIYRNEPRAYPIERNIDFKVRLEAAKAKGLKPRSLIRIDRTPNVAFILGCREDETCADAYFDGIGYRGALSKLLQDSITKQISIREAVAVCSKALSDEGFTQHPSIIGPDEILLKPFMERL